MSLITSVLEFVTAMELRQSLVLAIVMFATGWWFGARANSKRGPRWKHSPPQMANSSNSKPAAADDESSDSDSDSEMLPKDVEVAVTTQSSLPSTP
jgi:hypothetical protein